ncbi:MAG: type IV secretory system conjugative DNA transfer family protein [Actinobacteria bacterium]|nr:type IV secretory system conjugative DNA transfer family protein [Actinomycetota bacterium]
MSQANQTLVWREVSWPRPLSAEVALDLLGHLATDHTIGTVVWEAWSDAKGIRYLLGCSQAHLPALNHLIASHVEGARLSADVKRHHAITSAATIHMTHHSLSLSTDRVSAIVRAVLAGLAAAKRGQGELVLQVMLGARVSPAMLGDRVNDPRATWLDLILGSVRPASAETKASMKSKSSAHGFKAVIRIGARADSAYQERYLISNLFGGLRVAESAGAHLRLSKESPVAQSTARRPWRWPLVLSAQELVSLMGWPIGDGNLPGLSGVHPKLLAPPEGMRDSDRPFAVSSAPGDTVALGISAKDSLQHTVLLGPTGSGKSNAMLNTICADINAGRGVLLVDPKTDLAYDVLARIPESRRKDVVVIDPSDPCVVGLNPLAAKHRNPALVADSILAVFKALFSDCWGVRIEDVLTSSLLTLALHPNSSLVWLPSLLTNARFRHKLTAGITDRVGLRPFWDAYENMSAAQRDQVIAPTMTRLRQFLLRPALRAVLGQTQPLFEMGDLFTKRRIVLVSLNRGLLGTEGARLVGSLVVAQLWPLVLGRAALPPERRHIVSVFIDEAQDFLALPADLADALSQARALGVGLSISHQYRHQLPPALRAGVDTNARNKIVFGLNAGDAHDMAAMAPNLEPVDFMLLPRFGIYAHLMREGHSTGWISGQTMPACPPISDPVELKAASTATYGRPANEVDEEVLRAIGLTKEGDHAPEEGETVGRRPRRRS